MRLHDPPDKPLFSETPALKSEKPHGISTISLGSRLGATFRVLGSFLVSGTNGQAIVATDIIKEEKIHH